MRHLSIPNSAFHTNTFLLHGFRRWVPVFSRPGQPFDTSPFSTAKNRNDVEVKYGKWNRATSLFNTCTKNLENRQTDTEGTYTQTPSKLFRLSYQTTPTTVIPVFSRPGATAKACYRITRKRPESRWGTLNRMYPPPPRLQKMGSGLFAAWPTLRHKPFLHREKPE